MSRPSPRTVSSPGLAGLGAIVSLAAAPELARAGGLAPLALSATVAVFFGARVAGAEWRSPRPTDSPVGIVRRSLAEVAGVGLVAGSVATLSIAGADGAPSAGVSGFAVASAAWAAGAWLGPRAGLAAMVLGAVAAVAALDAGLAVGDAAPWTLLEPHWESWRSWGARAVTVGLLTAGAGAGPFTSHPRAPGQWRAPWAAVGLTILATTLGTVGLASRYEAALGLTPTGISPAVVVAAAVAGAAALAGGRWRLLAALGATAWLWGPGRDALPFVTTALAPACAAGALALAAREARSADRGWLGAGAAVLAATVVASGDLRPDGIGEAFGMGGIVVLGFWIVATRAALAHRARRAV